MISSWSRDDSTVIPSSPTQTVDRNDPLEPRTWLGPPTKSAVAGVYALPQFVQQVGADWIASKGSSRAISNYLIVDSASQTTRWLFSNADRFIKSPEPIRFIDPTGADVFLGFILAVVETDTNGDGHLSSTDLADLHFIPSDWSGETLIVENAVSVLRVAPLSRNALDVIYTTQAGAVLFRMNLPDATIASTLDLPKDGN